LKNVDSSRTLKIDLTSSFTNTEQVETSPQMTGNVENLPKALKWRSTNDERWHVQLESTTWQAAGDKNHNGVAGCWPKI